MSTSTTLIFCKKNNFFPYNVFILLILFYIYIIQYYFSICNRNHIANSYCKLEKENNRLQKIIDKFYETVDKFIVWIYDKFSLGNSKELVKTFEKDTNISLDLKQQIKKEEIEKEWDLEL